MTTSHTSRKPPTKRELLEALKLAAEWLNYHGRGCKCALLRDGRCAYCIGIGDVIKRARGCE